MQSIRALVVRDDVWAGVAAKAEVDQEVPARLRLDGPCVRIGTPGTPMLNGKVGVTIWPSSNVTRRSAMVIVLDIAPQATSSGGLLVSGQ